MARQTWTDVTIKAALIGAVVLIYLDLRSEIRSVNTRIDYVEGKLETRISSVETKIDRVETKIDRVETKIDEVRGYLKFNDSNQSETDTPSIPGK